MSSVNQKIRRLPGFRFEAVAPARDDVLPRMDVALFVGFASSGPIGIPVAVESAEQFKTIFGGDLPLVWDARKGAFIDAFLAPTVRSFFLNGGRRCWILRVARLESNDKTPLNRACYNFFPLAGLASVNFDKNEVENISPVFARARAKGSWSDDWQVGTAVLSRSLKLLGLSGDDKEKRATLEIGASETISAGDLLQFTFQADETVLLAAVDGIKAVEEIVSPQKPFGKRNVEITAQNFVWLKKITAEITPEKTHKVQVKMWTGQRTAETASFQSERAATFELLQSDDADSGQMVKLTFANLPAADAPQIGSILMTKLKKDLIALLVNSVNSVSDEKPEDFEVVCRALSVNRKYKKPDETPQVERLTFEISVKKDKMSFVKIGDLAYNERAARFFGELPTDEEFHRISDDSDQKIPSWTRTGDGLNFPLAGEAKNTGFIFPLFSTEFYQSAVSLSGTKLQRDGLETFDADLFLDRKLKNTVSANLLNEAEFIRYLSSRPRPLWGIHAALVPETSAVIAVESSPLNPAYSNYSLDECTIIAVPDAVHRGWFKTEDDGEILSPPVFSPPIRPEWWHFQDCRDPQPEKVSAPLRENFLDCTLRVVETPENLRVDDKGISAGKFTLVWKSTESDKNLEFVLQESSSPKFEFFEEIYRGKDRRFEVAGRAAGVYFYRVRAEIGKDFSNWSVGLAVNIPAAENWVVKKDYDADVLLAVQRALLRMCAARGDLFAVLNLPEHFEETDAFSYVGTLRATKGLTKATAGVEPFSADETRCLSYGAVYHPWLLMRDEGFEDVRSIPADGAMCGVLARRSIDRGAWIAPANEALQSVIGLAKEIRRERFLDFQDNAINLVRQEPRGFMVLDSDTLSDETDWRSINVRRLLSLLRRLAIKHGAEYVFEPNDERFRRQVQRGFASLLDQMFTRGAFAGKTPATAYQVVVGETVNDFRSIEQGRFIVELRVAPSLPLKFVTVRLIQAGARSNVVEVF